MATFDSFTFWFQHINAKTLPHGNDQALEIAEFENLLQVGLANLKRLPLWGSIVNGHIISENTPLAQLVDHLSNQRQPGINREYFNLIVGAVLPLFRALCIAVQYFY